MKKKKRKIEEQTMNTVEKSDSGFIPFSETGGKDEKEGEAKQDETPRQESGSASGGKTASKHTKTAKKAPTKKTASTKARTAKAASAKKTTARPRLPGKSVSVDSTKAQPSNTPAEKESKAPEATVEVE